jgi:N4-gp56 family major capsid protein
MVDTFSSLPIEDKLAYFERDMLYRAKPFLALARFGLKTNLPRRSGRQVNWRRMNQVSTATTPLTEGLTPVATNISLSEVTGTALQYGNYVLISDQIDMMAIDDIRRESNVMMGENAGQTVEEIIRAELLNGTNVLYPAGRSSRSTILSTDILTRAHVVRGTKALQVANARPFQGDRDDKGMGGVNMGYIHPYCWGDLQNDTTVLNAFIYSDPAKIWNYELPMLAGVAWYVSTKAPVFAGAGSGGANVYCTFIFAAQAFGIVAVAGGTAGGFESIAKDFGSGGTSDPLDQRATQGWKCMQLPKILNNTFMVRLESASNELAA